MQVQQNSSFDSSVNPTTFHRTAVLELSKTAFVEDTALYPVGQTRMKVLQMSVCSALVRSIQSGSGQTNNLGPVPIQAQQSTAQIVYREVDGGMAAHTAVRLTDETNPTPILSETTTRLCASELLTFGTPL